MSSLDESALVRKGRVIRPLASRFDPDLVIHGDAKFLAQVSRASYYRFEESGKWGSDYDMELRDAILVDWRLSGW